MLISDRTRCALSAKDRRKPGNVRNMQVFSLVKNKHIALSLCPLAIDTELCRRALQEFPRTAFESVTE